MKRKLFIGASGGRGVTVAEAVASQIKKVCGERLECGSGIAETRLPSIGLFSTAVCEPPSDIITGFLSLQMMIGRLGKALPSLSRGNDGADTSGF